MFGSLKSYKRCNTAPGHVFIMLGWKMGPCTFEKVIVTFNPSPVMKDLDAPFEIEKLFQSNHQTWFFRFPVPKSAY